MKDRIYLNDNEVILNFDLVYPEKIERQHFHSSKVCMTSGRLTRGIQLQQIEEENRAQQHLYMLILLIISLLWLHIDASKKL